MKKNIFSCLTVLICAGLLSCAKEEILDNPRPDPTTHSHYYETLQKNFAVALAKGLAEDKSLRAFIKEEAQLQFNRDNDVFYSLAKDKMLSNGKTFRQTLLPFFSEPQKLSEIEQALPLLTVLVPTLPENSFSPSLWNVEQDIPYVGVRLTSTNDVPVYDGKGEAFIVKANMVPGFPVVVVKDNERVTVGRHASSGKTKGASFKASGQQFQFIDEAFDNLTGSAKENSAGRLVRNPDPKLIAARDLGLEWHRDHIYYNLTPSNDRGEFSYDFMEYITSFSFANGEQGYTKIADQTGDNRIIHGGSTGWTDGMFEFRVDALINGKVTTPMLRPMFGAHGSDLFDVEYEKIIVKKCRPPFCFGSDVVLYIPKTITAKTFSPNVPLINWDLDSYSSSMVIKFEEYDISETIKETNTVSSKFAMNFEISGQIKKKIGFKFGAVHEQNTSQSHERTYTLASDYLGEAIVNFGDKVIVGEVDLLFLKYYRTREYSTGFVNFSVEPRRVQ